MTGDRSEPAPIEVEIRFERFPASIRGAFVFRGADGNPHAIRLASARVARVPAGPVKPIPAEDRLIDVAPSRDLFVPFEVGVSDLPPAWYAVESSVQVDAGRSFEFSSRPFTVPWSRSDVRRGSMVVGRTVTVGDARFVVDRLDMTSDCAVVSWRREGSGPDDASGGSERGGAPVGEAVLIADGRPLELLPSEAGGRAAGARNPGEARTVTYPVPRACRSLELAIALSSGQRSDPFPVRLP